MRMLRRAFVAGAFVALSACSSSSENNDAGATLHGVGGACATVAQCRHGLVCAPDSHTCQPQSTAHANEPCQLTLDCVDGLYCAASGTCAPAGDAVAGATCGDTSSCVRGLVCVRNASSLYGVCTVPGGGTGTSGDGGVASASGHDLNEPCTATIDCLAGLACSPTSHSCRPGVPGDGLATGWAGEHCDDGAPDAGAGAPVRAYFEVPAVDGTPPHDFFRLPFPNDIRRDPTTHHIDLTGFPHPGTDRIGFDIVDRYARASERDLDGFGTNQIVYFRFSSNIDFDTLRLGDTIQLLDLTADGATRSIRFGANTAGDRYLCANNLTVDTGAGAPMAPGHTYAALLTTGIHAPGGQPVVRDADFGPMLAAGAPTDARLARAWTAYAPLRAYLTAHSIDPSTVLDAAVFTTQSVTPIVPALRDAVRAQPPPAATGFVRCDTGVVSPCDDGLTGDAHVRGCMGPADPAFDELQGQIDVPVFQQGTRPYRTPGEGAIALDAAGHPMAQGTERVCVTVTVPHGVAMPAGGWPVVLYAHGTGGNYRSGVSEGIARELASIDLGGGAIARVAMVGYEGVMHGARRGAGVTDSPNELFFNFANPQAARDNVLQGAADVFALVRAIETVSLPMLPTASDTTHFDPQHIVFLGHSQGSTVGAAAVAYEPDLVATVLSGAGGDLRASLTTKRHPVDIASLVPFVLEDPDANAGHPVLNLFQAFFERSDAVNYGPHLLYDLPAGVPLRPLVQTYGLGDTFSTEPTMQALATSIGLPAAAPIPVPRGGTAWPDGMGTPLPIMNNVRTSAGLTTAALLEADPMGAYDGHYVLFRDGALAHRTMVFIGTAVNGAASVR